MPEMARLGGDGASATFVEIQHCILDLGHHFLPKTHTLSVQLILPLDEVLALVSVYLTMY
jgi:hypothetical protein